MAKQYAGDDQSKCQLEKSEDCVNAKVWRGKKVNLCQMMFRNIGTLMFQWFNVRTMLVSNYQITPLVSGS